MWKPSQLRRCLGMLTIAIAPACGDGGTAPNAVCASLKSAVQAIYGDPSQTTTGPELSFVVALPNLGANVVGHVTGRDEIWIYNAALDPLIVPALVSVTSPAPDRAVFAARHWEFRTTSGAFVGERDVCNALLCGGAGAPANSCDVGDGGP